MQQLLAHTDMLISKHFNMKREHIDALEKLEKTNADIKDLQEKVDKANVEYRNLLM
jgi:hypothetical protein